MRRVNSTLAVLCVLALSALGVILAFSIPSSVFPEITFDRAIILADSGDLPPEQMLVSVTRPLEEAAYGVVGVSLVRSTTTRGSSEIDVTFDPSANATTAYQLLNAALSEVRARLPAGSDINTRLLTTGTFPIVDVSMSSQGRSLADLTDIALYDVVPSFHRISGVYRVEVVGGKYREFVVRLDPARMLEHGLSPQEIVDGLAKANIVASAGRVLDSHRMLLTVVTTNVREAAELAALPVASAAGAPVRVSDVGAVELGIREDYVRTASEHGPAVLVGISRQPAGNTVTIAAETRTIVATLAPALSRRDLFVFLRSVRTRHRIVPERARRDRLRTGPRGAGGLRVHAQPCQRARRGDRRALHACDHVRRDEGCRADLQHDDAGRPGRRNRLVHRRRDRDDRGDSSRALDRDGDDRRGSRRARRTIARPGRLDDDGDRRVRAAGISKRRDRRVFPLTGRDARRGPRDLAGAGALLHARARDDASSRCAARAASPDACSTCSATAISGCCARSSGFPRFRWCSRRAQSRRRRCSMAMSEPTICPRSTKANSCSITSLRPRARCTTRRRCSGGFSKFFSRRPRLRRSRAAPARSSASS